LGAGGRGVIEKPDWLINFELSDFQCRCRPCSWNPNRPHTRLEVIREVQKLRDMLGRPLVVTCGVRCPMHNAEVGGANQSRHLPDYADAVDFHAPNGVERFDIIQKAMSRPFAWTAFEVSSKHVHLDARPGARMFVASPC